MATIADLSYDVLSLIIILLVQSSNGAEQLARILSVSRTFLVFKQDVDILKVVRFDRKCSKLLMCRDINSLVVRCAETGNISAQALLGKVILLNLHQLFVSECQKLNFARSPYDRASPSHTLATNAPVQNTKMCYFVSYFLPSEASQTRLVHYQLVKVFLLHCSHHEIVKMGVSLRAYINYFSRGTKEDRTLLHSVNDLLLYASRLRRMENLIELKERVEDCYQVSIELQEQHEKELRSKHHDDPSSSSTERYFHSIETKCYLLSVQLLTECERADVDWPEVMKDGTRFSDNLREAYIDFGACRDQTLLLYSLIFP